MVYSKEENLLDKSLRAVCISFVIFKMYNIKLEYNFLNKLFLTLGSYGGATTQGVQTQIVQ